MQQPIVVTSSIQTATPEDTPPSSPVTRPAPPKTITVEERLAQLRHTLATTNAERESVSSQLKVARRESQRAEAAIRSELDGLKRASEKSALADQRARQKTLALQEATKQSLAAAADAEEQVRLVEDSLPQLNARSKAVEMEHRKLKREAARSSCEADEAIKADKKRITDLEAELATLGNRLDKLKHKKEKFVNDTVPQLEEQLASLAKEMEQIEKGTVPLHELNEFDHETLYPHHYAVPAFVPHHPHPPTNMTRPSPIQRPVPHQTLNYPVNPLPTPSEPRGLPIPQPFYSPAHFVPRTPVAIAPLNGRSPPRHGIRTSTGSSNEGGFVSPISPARSSNPFGNGPVRSNINNSSNAIRRPSK